VNKPKTPEKKPTAGNQNQKRTTCQRGCEKLKNNAEKNPTHMIANERR
jgi:hypothetical protein